MADKERSSGNGAERNVESIGEDEMVEIDVESYLNVDFPADRDELVAHAEGLGAPAAVIDILSDLPDMQYANVAEVTRELEAMLDEEADMDETG